MLVMSYEVLARKLRPSGFDALVGQDHVVRALSHALDQGRVHHAYLFTGTRGVGKTTIARILAKALNCERGISSTPCGECSVCNEVRENRFLDLIEVDAASRTGVDDTRELLENAQYMPTRGRYKVYLIDEVHMLSTASFNALLKTLEEPPEHVKFLLATTDPKKVPATVLSRCLQFQLKNMSRQVIEEYLASVLSDENIAFADGALKVIARSAAGSMRDALSLTDQAIAYGEGALSEKDVTDMLGIVGEQDVEVILDGLKAGEAAQLLTSSAELAEQNADFAELLGRIAEALHRMAVASATGSNSEPFADEEIQLLYQIALMGSRDIDLAPEPRSGFEMTLLRMLTFAPNQGSSVGPLGSGSGEKIQQSGSSNRPDPDSAPPSGLKASGHASDVQSQDADLPVVSRQDGAADTSVPVIHHDEVHWYEIVMALSIGGVSRMICENAALVEFALPRIVLCLAKQHETLLSENQRAQLERALSDYFDRQVVLEIELGEPQTETPAEQNERVAQERQVAAETTIEQDPTVTAILTEFGGQVEDIRPI